MLVSLRRPSALIVYDGLPVSSGGAHLLRLRDRYVVWDRMRGFLNACTTCEEPDEVRLLLAEGPHLDRSFFEQAVGLAGGAFGAATRRVSVVGATQTEYEHAWMLRPNEIGEALAVMDQLPAIPEHLGRGLLVLSIEALFLLRDPETGRILPGQGADLYGDQEAEPKLFLGQSRVYLRLSQRSTCALFLSLPFPEVSRAAFGLIGQLQETLPFRLSPARWARWQLNAQGTRYYKRRLNPSLLPSPRNSGGAKPPLRT